jgi:hypothetical protein
MTGIGIGLLIHANNSKQYRTYRLQEYQACGLLTTEGNAACCAAVKARTLYTAKKARGLLC